MSSRFTTAGGAILPTTASDVDFGYAHPMQSSFVGGFEAGGGMAMPGDRPPLLFHQQSVYDGLDFAAAAFPFVQEPGTPLFYSGSSAQSGLLQQTAFGCPQLTTMPMALASPSSMQAPMMMLPGVPTGAPDMYTFGGGGYVKREDAPLGDVGGSGRIGLNLGGRTYFSPTDVLAVDRLLMLSRLGGGGGGTGPMDLLGLGLGAAHHHHQPPRCQADGCKADLSAAKHYHRRHKVCEYHAKAAAVAAAGKQQRFCQQCSRFHVLGEFDEAKRSCRKRLTEHNRRRRKPAGAHPKDSPPAKKAASAGVSSSYTGADRSAAAPIGAGGGFSRILMQQQQQEQLDSDVVGQASSSSNTATTALSLLAGAPPPHGGRDVDDGAGGLDTMLLIMPQRRHVLQQDGDDHDNDQDHRHHLQTTTTTTATSLNQPTHHRRGNFLSSSPAPSTTDHQDTTAVTCCTGGGGGMQHFFELDFM